MSTEKSCETCRNCNCNVNREPCNSCTEYLLNWDQIELTPAQQHAEELLERLKEEHYENSPLHYQYPSKFIKTCPICQLIAKVEGKE